MSTSYLNFDGKVMAASAAPQHWLETAYQGQTLVGPAGPDQFTDQLGGSPTFVGGGGEEDNFRCTSMSVSGHCREAAVAAGGEADQGEPKRAAGQR